MSKVNHRHRKYANTSTTSTTKECSSWTTPASKTSPRASRSANSSSFSSSASGPTTSPPRRAPTTGTTFRLYRCAAASATLSAATTFRPFSRTCSGKVAGSDCRLGTLGTR
uniref:(northern house mosquito) hypothetical protein n=1 Tax=Culex pipiens TaxID=7175 RepID=A0A8D8BDS5_CULPI